LVRLAQLVRQLQRARPLRVVVVAAAFRQPLPRSQAVPVVDIRGLALQAARLARLAAAMGALELHLEALRK
jgi:hypothetical protein